MAGQGPFGEFVDTVLSDREALTNRWQEALASSSAEIVSLRDGPDWLRAQVGTLFHEYINKRLAGTAEPGTPWPPLVGPWHIEDADVRAWLLSNGVEPPPVPRLIGTTPPLPVQIGGREAYLAGDPIYDGPWLPAPNPPYLIAHLDALAELAETTLLPAFADIPPSQRYTGLVELVGTACVRGVFALNYPDAILGDTMLEVKTGVYRSPVRELRRQMALQVLLDLYDRYKVRYIAWYLAKQGALIRAPLAELLITDQVPLEELRERYRQARAEFEFNWLTRLQGRPHAAAPDMTQVVIAFWEQNIGWLQRNIATTPLEQGLVEYDRQAVELAVTKLGALVALDAIRGWTRELIAGRLDLPTSDWHLERVLKEPDMSYWVGRASALHPDPETTGTLAKRQAN